MLIETPEGLVFKLNTGEQSYLSKACLNAGIIDFIKSKLKTITINGQ
jgi:hypothetical protein